MMAQTLRRGVVLCAFMCGLLTFVPRAAWAAEPSLDELVAATKSADEATRLKAIEALGTQGAPAVAVLVPLLQADSPVARAYAARALGAIGAPAKSAAEALIAVLADPEPGVRRQALAALKSIRPGPKVTVPLFAKLMQDSDPGMRMRVMEAVADAKGQAVPALVEALRDKDASYWACLILRDIGPDAVAAVPALGEALRGPRPEIRREATLALAAIGSPDAVASIVPLLKDPDLAVRIAATYALGAIGQIPPAAESIVLANAKGADALLSTTSIWAVARVRPKDMQLKRAAITHLVARLKDKDPYVRAAAARALVALPPSPEISGPIFEKALSDADATTVHYMLDSLAGLGPPAVPRLIAALKHELLRAQVAYILGQIGPQAAPATEALARLVGDEDPNVSIEATHALAKIGPGAKGAVPALTQALQKPEGKSSHAAAFALGMIGPDAASAEPALLEVIKGLDNSLSLISAWALIRIRGASADTAGKVLPELIAGLESPQPDCRQTAAEALGGLGPFAKSAAPQLERAAKDGDERVRGAAGKALAAVRG